MSALKLYRVRECGVYGKPKDYVAADAFVAALSPSHAVDLFIHKHGEVKDFNVTEESTPFLIGTE